MNPSIRVLSCLLIVASLISVISCDGGDSSGIRVLPAAGKIGRFETLTARIALSTPFTNPYDSDDIQVDLLVNTPDGQKLALPCFYTSGSSEESEWEARYTAMQAGKHSCRIQVVSQGDSSRSGIFHLKVMESGRDGFLRLNPQSLYSFVFDSGKRYRGVGLNVCWEMQSDWKHPYETYFDELERNHADFMRIWMCPWNLPLEWARVPSYEVLTDEFENWEKTYSHSPGLQLVRDVNRQTEEDSSRITMRSNSTETIVYQLENIRKFKVKLFYRQRLSEDKIKCYWSTDDVSYTPIEIEFSQAWDTQTDWQRVFIAYIKELPAGANYLKIELLKDMEGTPNLASIEIEHGEATEVLDAPGLGRYYEKTAKRLDEILRLAEEKGVYIMLAHDYHGLFKDYIDRWASNAEWRTCPYNAANGGPCETPTDFFTNAEAKKIYKKRLRYMVARWGFSTYLACWEFWNEIDNVMEWQGVPAEAITTWHREMADYLKEIDPYEHLVTTSVVYREVPGLWDIENLDFTQHHNYGPTNDMKTSILNYVNRFQKPDVVGEYALGWKGPGKDQPAELYEGKMHNGLWRGMFSPTPVLPLTWWWEWHLQKQHYHHFRAAADFVALMITKNEDVLGEITVSGGAAKVECLGLKSGDDRFVWLRNPGAEVQNELSLTVEGTGTSQFIAKYYDTWTGKFSEELEIESVDDQILLKGFRLASAQDKAVWLRPKGQ